MDKSKAKKKQSQESILQAGLSGATTEVVQRFGSAVREHIVAYSGMDNETGTRLSKGLADIAKSKVNPDFAKQNLNQQAGFAAEVKTVARENAECIINGNKVSHTVRTDDMVKQSDGKGNSIGGRNDQLYDVAEVNKNGKYVKGTARQLKHVGGEDAGKCTQTLLSREYAKYRENNVPLEVPSNLYDDVRKELESRIQKLKKQIIVAERLGKGKQVEALKEKLKQTEQVKQNLRKGKVSTRDAREARTNPKLSTAKDMARVAHKAGLAGAKVGAVVGGTVSIVRNVVALAQKKVSAKEATLAVAKDTAVAMGTGYASASAGALLKGCMGNAKSSLLRTASKTNLPGQLVMATLEVSSVMRQFIQGKISGEECLESLGERGTGMVASALFATIGQVAIPIPVVGGMVGGMLGYAVASASYKELLNALKEKRVAAEERQCIEAMCAEHIRQMQAFRAQLDAQVKHYLASTSELFDSSFKGIQQALEIGDVDGVIASSCRIVEAAGKKPLFHTMDELDQLVSGDVPIVL